ncbi:MAG TPA: D-lyxose/D-mannose family sugar isomerase [Planctomycetota bacterium]|nr:D-lyxose/D-mannose family sugar isomerase [Planctomycetota bacterium]
MKRSEINQFITSAKEFFALQKFLLPPFAFWSPHDWESVGPEGDEIRLNKLGWDLTDFGSGNFQKTGLLLFTLRNGNLKDPTSVKSYAEKIMIVDENQVTPFHFHWQKTEDIINRGGGNLIVELYNSDAQERFTSEAIRVRCDGVLRTVRAGGSIVLKPGESVTLVPRLYHKFYGEPGRGRVLVGEVSSVNDDASDNRFSDPIGRFPQIEEDAAPLHFLCNEYPHASR